MQVQVVNRYKVQAGADPGGNKEQEDAGRFNLVAETRRGQSTRSRKEQGAGRGKVQEGTRSTQEQGAGRNKVHEGKDAGRNKEKASKRSKKEQEARRNKER
jgi:hypothetical protein